MIRYKYENWILKVYMLYKYEDIDILIYIIEIV